MTLLSTDFLSNYPDMPEHMNALASFVFHRTYSRWLPDQKRRETFKEAITRAVEYNVGITLLQFKRNNFPPPIDSIIKEAEILFDNIFNLRQFLSGRTHWVGGAESGVADKFPLSNFNCAFIDVTCWDDLCDLFYLLLIGTGDGFKGSKEAIAKLPPIRTDFELTHSVYEPLPKKERLEHTSLNDLGNGYAKIYIGDSKEGWVTALKMFLRILTEDHFASIKHIKISYNSIRPKGERLVTFGGTASGHTSLQSMFEGFEKVLKNTLDETLRPMVDNHVRPIHILDMGTLIGNNVVVGGVRRTALMFLCDEDDEECIAAKQHINTNPSISHRCMSNNSIAFNTKPTREYLHNIFEMMRTTGEPAFVNMEAARKRRPNAKGVNPCGEVLLDSYGVCNLTTVNIMGFVVDGQLDYQGLMQAQALSARAGIRMTCLDLELPHWDKVQKRDRLIGCSMTGWRDAMNALDYDEDQESNLRNLLREIVEETCIKYSYILRIPTPLLDTTIKPEGTLSQVANGVSNGLHDGRNTWHIRRIRINASDPLAKVAILLNWTIHPENNTSGETLQERLSNANTLVIDFPINCVSTPSRPRQTAVEQLETYFKFQEEYTAHNSSNTISVKEDEWDAVEEVIWNNWDNFIGVSFMPYDGGGYKLAPYEDITEEAYNALVAKMKPFDLELLRQLERDGLDETSLDGADGCEGGQCPIR